VHSSRRGGVLSSRTPTASGMALQYPGWRRGSGDGRTGLMVTEGTHLTGPTSWHRPGGVRQASVLLSRVPPSSFEGAARGPYESGRHSVTELTLASSHNDV
jgi:hypothetical protein